jgi:peptide chain release factor 1
MTNPYQDQIQQLEKKIKEHRAVLDDPELSELANQEITSLKNEIKILQQAADKIHSHNQQSQTIQDKVYQNAILEFRQGTGGNEAKIWAEELMRMYTRFAQNLNLKVEFIDDLVIKIKGRANLIANQPSLTAYQLFQFESGVHRVQRVPVTESQGRVHTSTATVAVLPEVRPQEVSITEDDLHWEFMRSSGAGGQSVNKTNSAVRLTHLPTGIAVTARQERKQTQNRQIALELLRSQLWEIKEEEKLKKIGQARSAIGSAKRAEKIRTYNFPQNRVTDHRIKQSWYNLEEIINGNLKTVVIKTYQQLSS